MAEAIHDIFQANEFRDVWLASEMNKFSILTPFTASTKR
jgi:hypothetical protein